MRYHVLAADYDGTLAHHGQLEEHTIKALVKLRESGRKLVMVTGRELDELLALLPDPTLFDRIVAENGALVYDPKTKEIITVSPGPPASFVNELEKRGVERIAVGRVIVATWEPHQDAVLATIRDQGLELQVIFNKGAVMILPSGINKASGLVRALSILGISMHNCVAVGDAENDHALLGAAECGVAVENALASLKDAADFVTTKDHGHGVAELIEHLLADDLAVAAPRLKRHWIKLGKAGEREIAIDPYRANLMVCGTSGSGKSTLTTGLLERLQENGYQFAILDPEGDYASSDLAVVLGSPQRAPLVDEVIDVLTAGKDNVVANLLGVSVDHRPETMAELVPALVDLRTRTGRPHWLIVDEAHHLLPAAWLAPEVPMRQHGTLYITVHPASVRRDVLDTLDTVIIVGERPLETMEGYCKAAGRELPEISDEIRGIEKLAAGTVIYWKLDGVPQIVITEKPKSERKRHGRKYSEGNLGKDRSFTFTGPDGKLNLRAPNLHLFLHLADGVDDATWEFHRQKGEYSAWLRTEVKDPDLATEVEAAESDETLDAKASRAVIRGAVEKRYTLPADKPSGIIDPE